MFTKTFKVCKLFFFSLAFIAFASLTASAVETANQTVQTDWIGWALDHWEGIGLVVSELLALTSSKYTGIVTTILKIGKTILQLFQNQSNFSKS